MSTPNPNAGFLTVKGATFGKGSFSSRPTAMSIALADAGVIPGTHIIQEFNKTAVVRSRNDMTNMRNSIKLAFA